MKTSDKEYFELIKNRNEFTALVRRVVFMRPLLKEFEGWVLDVGCGVGDFLEMYPHSYGVDNNRSAVEHCKKKGLNCRLGNAYNLPFKGESFNGIYCSQLLEHLSEPEKAIREFRRILRKDGKIIIIVPTKSGFDRDKTHKTYLHEKNLSSILVNNGFKILKIEYFPFSSKGLRDSFYFNELRVFARKIK